MKQKSRLPWIFVLLVSLLLSSCSGVNLNGAADPTPIPTVTLSSGTIAEGHVVPMEFTTLSFPVRGDVAEINVSEGDQVSKDTILISLNQAEQLLAALDQAKLAQITAQQQLDQLNRQADLNQARAKQELATANVAVSDAQKALDDLDTADFREELDDKRIAVQNAEDDLSDKQDTLDKYLDLAEDNSTRKSAQTAVDDAQRALHAAQRDYVLLQSDLDQAQSALDLAMSQQKEAQYKLDASQNGPDKDELALAQAQLDSANSQLAAAQYELDQLNLLAPYDGTVMEIQNLAVGETVNPGQVVVTFANKDTWYVETKDLTELDVVNIRVGQKVTVTPDALPNIQLNGVVESIGNVYTEKNYDVLYTVRIQLEKPDPALRWGMTVNITFPE
ncbi:MAG: efflux RND transporter periplasmic adaptor subunit [Anaerolineaceae bacterium]